MKATYIHEGGMTLDGLIKFCQHIQAERSGNIIVGFEAETTDNGGKNFIGERVFSPSHIVRITVEDE